MPTPRRRSGLLHRRAAAGGRADRRQPRPDLLLHLRLAQGRHQARAEHQGRLSGEGRQRHAVTVGTDTFKLFGKGERGFVSDPTEELKLIESMKKGSSAVVRGDLRQGHRHDRHLLAVGPRASARQDGGRLPLAAQAPTPRAEAR